MIRSGVGSCPMALIRMSLGGLGKWVSTNFSAAFFSDMLARCGRSVDDV